jgi:glutamyl-tRNA reductase
MKQKEDYLCSFTQIKRAIDKLSKNVVCYFVDYKVFSKRSVYEISKDFKINNLINKNILIIHTCLRLEIYSFTGNLSFSNSNLFAEIKNKLAIRRLITLMCGMQSEIFGEKEILGQIEKSIVDSALEGFLKKDSFWHLLDLVKFAKFLRNKFKINCNENYSSVGINILNKLIKKENECISIIGDGYMSEFFFKKLDRKRPYKIFWINRNIEKAKKIQRGSDLLKKLQISHIDIKEGLKVLNQSDFVFAALKNSEGLFAGYQFNHPKAIVDVSYPPVFSDDCNKFFYSIENTFFEKYIKKPIKKIFLRSCESEIEEIIN